ncbi:MULTISPECIES: site-specific DNA-methyltransferase [unclassified Acinetobacter]|uniref:site-specific DNA-methyltransferase n=2 Tax=Acinetobacter TaxID=469 RepID=UPI00124CB82E|nr:MULTISPECIES: site-specific DNA-methyltransferase [unclassified Acinetobacter]
MDKLKMHSPNLVDANIEKIAALFPNCITETKDENGELKKAVDFDLLKQELSQVLVEGEQERYRLDWVGKKEAILTANAPIAKTLRPCREESVNFDSTENLFIEGDNLEALKLLQENYLGKVKMIYIDPPYNTGNDFIYEDDFAESTNVFFERSNQTDDEGNKLIANTESNGRFHSDWLSMMYSRLKLAWSLLKDDGLIVIHIDENEYSNLEKILNEIFGEHNNLGTIIWDKRNPKGDSQGIAIQHELIVFFSKNKDVFKSSNNLKKEKENAECILEKAKELISFENAVNVNVRKKFKDWLLKQNFNGGELAYNQIDDRGRVFQTVSMAWPNNKKAPDDYFIPLIHPKTKKPCPVPEKGWRNPPKTMNSLLEKDLIVFGVDETTQPRRKYLLEENMTENLSSLLYYGGSDDKILKSIGIFFDNPKPLYVAQKVIGSIIANNEIIMDFFGGSGTTAHAILNLNVKDAINRKFILVQMNAISKNEISNNIQFDTISNLSKERIRRAGKKILEDNADKDGIENLDIGFRVLKIDSSNMKDVYYTPDALKQADMLDLASNIKEDRTSEDLLFQVMLDWGLELSLPIERKTIAGKEVFYVAGNSLVACFDDLTFDVVDEVAKDHPLRFVSAEKAIHLDHDKTNIKERFKQLSPDTEVKFL